jgi:hypothetical protein
LYRYVKERDQATVEMNAVQQNFNDHGGGGASSTLLTHSLKAAWFQPLNLKCDILV